MKIVDFDQSSESWLEWRTNGVGASDIGVIMGVDPYKKPKRLWEEKCGFKGSPKSNFAMEHGRKNESVALKKFNEEMDMKASPICIEDDISPHWRASLDGWDEGMEMVVEIKCPVSASKISEIVSTGRIPDVWYYQIQYQLCIAKPCHESAYFALYDARDDSMWIKKIKYDQYVVPKILDKVEEFWKNVRSGVCPY